MATDEELTAIERRARFAGIGCFSVLVGAFSMSMVGVLVSLVVRKVTGGPVCQDIPACDWYIYAGWGAVFGAVSLPILVLNRVRQSEQDRAARRNS
jgi:hypothetical protein